jgi:hypothetical protein
MATWVNTFAKGRIIEKCSLPLGTDNILIIPLQSTGLPSDTTLRNAANLAAIFTAGGLEATFTNYARKVLAGTDITIANNLGTFQATATVNAAQSWASAGGAVNNTIAKIVVAYRPTSSSPDSSCMVLATQDYSGSTTGGAFTVTVGVLTAA